MNFTLKSEKEEIVTLSFFTQDIKDAIVNTDLGEGTPLNPISIDAFVKNDLGGLPVVAAGSILEMRVEHDHPEIAVPKLLYSKIQNITKNYSGFMNEEAWREIFDWSNWEELYTVAPDGSLYVAADEEGVCQILTRKTTTDIFIAYRAALSFEFDNRNYYFSIDPFAKIVSNPPSNPV